MNSYVIQRDPLRVEAMGTTRVGLIVASMKGLFEASGAAYPEEGEEIKRPFQLETNDAPSLILAILRLAATSARDNGEMYAEISFSLITDKKATGEFVGRKLPSVPSMPEIRGIDGQIVKDGDGVWRAVVALA